MNNPWEKLGIEPTDNISQIKNAYSSASKKYHPEDNPVEFQLIYSAYKECLKKAKNPSKNNDLYNSVMKEILLNSIIQKAPTESTRYKTSPSLQASDNENSQEEKRFTFSEPVFTKTTDEKITDEKVKFTFPENSTCNTKAETKPVEKRHSFPEMKITKASNNKKEPFFEETRNNYFEKYKPVYIDNSIVTRITVLLLKIELLFKMSATQQNIQCCTDILTSNEFQTLQYDDVFIEKIQRFLVKEKNIDKIFKQQLFNAYFMFCPSAEENKWKYKSLYQILVSDNTKTNKAEHKTKRRISSLFKILVQGIFPVLICGLLLYFKFRKYFG